MTVSNLFRAILLFSCASLTSGAEPTGAPTELPAGLPALEAPRNWGDTFLPKSKPPAREVLSVSLAGLKTDERIAVTCLQGLLAREQPRIWLVRNQEDPFWMEWHGAKGHVERFEAVADWTALVDRFRGVAKGAVIPDEKLFRGDLLAVNVAACEDLIVTSPQLAERLGLPVKLDLRGRFATYAEGLQWLWANYKDRFNPHLCDFRHPGLLPHGTFDDDIALALSDGDNQILWPAFFRRSFEHPAFGKFPLAFGMGPAIRELQPGLAQWYFEHATPTTEFFADVSGAGYMQPDHFAEAYVDRQRVWTGFLQWTRRLMEPLGQRTIRTVGGSDENVTRYAEALPFCHSIFADMGRYSGRSGIANLTYSLPSGLPVFRAVTSWRYGKEGFLREIREQVGSQRPAFVNGFVHCWTFTMDDLVRIHEQRDSDMIFVTPSQLAELYHEAQTKRW
jgi:hypothetical protein